MDFCFSALKYKMQEFTQWKQLFEVTELLWKQFCEYLYYG